MSQFFNSRLWTGKEMRRLDQKSGLETLLVTVIGKTLRMAKSLRILPNGSKVMLEDQKAWDNVMRKAKTRK